MNTLPIQKISFDLLIVVFLLGLTASFLRLFIPSIIEFYFTDSSLLYILVISSLSIFYLWFKEQTHIQLIKTYNLLFFILLILIASLQTLYIGFSQARLSFELNLFIAFIVAILCALIVVAREKMYGEARLNKTSTLEKGLKQNILPILIIVALLVFGVVLRLYRLGWWSYWIDELNSMLTAKNIISGAIVPEYIKTRAFFYHSYLAFFLNVTNATALYARLANFIFTAGIVGIILFVAKKYFTKTAAIIAVGLFTLSPLAINMFRYIRFYESAAFLLLPLTLSFFYFIESFQFHSFNVLKYVTNVKNILWLLVSIVLVLVASDSQFLTLLIGPSVMVYLLLLCVFRREKKHFLLFFGGISALMLGSFVFLKTINPLTLFQINYPSWFYYTNPAPFSYYTNLIFTQFSPILIAIGIVGSFFVRKEANPYVKNLTLFIAVVIITITGFLTYSRYSLDHYIYILIPLLSLLLALGITLFIKNISTNSNSIFIALLITILSFNFLWNAQKITVSRENAYTLNFEAVTSYIKEHYNDGDKIIVSYYAQPVDLYDLHANYLFVDLDRYIIDHPEDTFYNLLKLPIVTKENVEDIFKKSQDKRNKVFFVIVPTREVSQETYRILTSYTAQPVALEDSKILLYVIEQQK